jgi:hypothetical protein
MSKNALDLSPNPRLAQPNGGRSTDLDDGEGLPKLAQKVDSPISVDEEQPSLDSVTINQFLTTYFAADHSVLLTANSGDGHELIATKVFPAHAAEQIDDFVACYQRQQNHIEWSSIARSVGGKVDSQIALPGLVLTVSANADSADATSFEQLPIKPSALIRSSKWLSVVWLFDHAIDLTSPSGRTQEYELREVKNKVSRRLFGNGPQRLLLLPGTVGYPYYFREIVQLEMNDRPARVSAAELREAFDRLLYKLEPPRHPKGQTATPAGNKRAGSDVYLALHHVSEYRPEPVSWLWRHKFARGAINLFAADPAQGKGFIIKDTAARITRGLPFPDSAPACPGSVVLVGAEESLQHTVRPQLDAQGADSDKVCVFDARNGDGSKIQFNLGKHLPQLENLINEIGDVVLLVFDPITAYLGDDAQAFKDDKVRALLTPLAEMAERTNVAVIMIMHLNKTEELKTRYRVGGSIAFVAAARMAWAIAEDADNDERRLFLNLKTSLTARNPPGLAFIFETLDSDPERARLVWEAGDVTIKLRDVLAAKPRSLDLSRSRRRWLNKF